MGGQFACEVVSSLSVSGTHGLVLPVLGSGHQDFRPLPIYSVASWKGKDWAACRVVSSEGLQAGQEEGLGSWSIQGLLKDSCFSQWGTGPQSQTFCPSPASTEPRPRGTPHRWA